MKSRNRKTFRSPKIQKIFRNFVNFHYLFFFRKRKNVFEIFRREKKVKLKKVRDIFRTAKVAYIFLRYSFFSKPLRSHIYSPVSTYFSCFVLFALFASSAFTFIESTRSGSLFLQSFVSHFFLIQHTYAEYKGEIVLHCVISTYDRIIEI